MRKGCSCVLDRKCEGLGTPECKSEFVMSADKRGHFCHLLYRKRDDIVMRLLSTPASYIMQSRPWVEVGRRGRTYARVGAVVQVTQRSGLACLVRRSMYGAQALSVRK